MARSGSSGTLSRPWTDAMSEKRKSRMKKLRDSRSRPNSVNCTTLSGRRTYQPPPPPPPPPPPEKPPPPPPEKPDDEEETGWAAIIAALMPVATEATALENPARLV